MGRLLSSPRISKQIFYRLTEIKATQLIGALYTIYCAEPKPVAVRRRKSKLPG